MDTIKGDLVSLRPLSIEDKETFYLWATQSDATPFWYGALYGEAIPSRQEFFNDWTDEYFDGSQAHLKRSFAIVINKNKREIGQINYQIEGKAAHRNYDLDIIIASDKDKSKGYGSCALKLLANHLELNYSPKRISIHGLKSNERAIRSYQKSGFSISKEYCDEKNNIWIALIYKNQ